MVLIGLGALGALIAGSASLAVVVPLGLALAAVTVYGIWRARLTPVTVDIDASQVRFRGGGDRFTIERRKVVAYLPGPGGHVVDLYGSDGRPVGPTLSLGKGITPSEVAQAFARARIPALVRAPRPNISGSPEHEEPEEHEDPQSQDRGPGSTYGSAYGSAYESKP